MHSYGFLCIAEDKAGNVEVQEPVAEATTKIKVTEKETISYTILESNRVVPPGYLGYRGSPFKIISENKGYRSIYMGLHIDEVPKPQAPSVDFTKNRVLYISFGKYRTAEHSIKLLNI